MDLRPYQIEALRRIYQILPSRPLVVLPTGAGKSLLIARLAVGYPGRVVIVAHRDEIIRQLSCALPCTHDLITRQTGRRVCVASVDTLLRRSAPAADLVIFDEAHHCLKGNKWGRALAMFPGAACIGFTATPERADGRALDLWDTLTECATGEDLITSGYLRQPRIYAPRGDLVRADYPTESRVGAWVRRSTVTGNVVEHYLKLAPCALGMTFASDVQHGRELLAEFHRWGIPAEMVTADTPACRRAAIMEQFRARKLLQLVNVDLYGEGTNVPDLEVVSLARPTKSLAVHRQQCGRVMRPGGQTCLIIDHVGNTLAHGLPWEPRRWSLAGWSARAASALPLRACHDCTAVYDRSLIDCPFCGYIAEPAERSSPASVDGDLVELEAPALAAIAAEVARIDGAGYFGHLPAKAAGAARRRHRERQQAQGILRARIDQWMSTEKDQRVGQRKFYLIHGIDVMTARTLGRNDALKLAGKIV